MGGCIPLSNNRAQCKLWCGAVRHAAYLRTCIFGADATQMAAALFVARQTPRLSLWTTGGWPAQGHVTRNFEKTQSARSCENGFLGHQNTHAVLSCEHLRKGGALRRDQATN
jgi:IS1 family transposase